MMTSIESRWLPTAMPRYSQNPPSIAPIRLAPKAAEGNCASRNVVEKMIPAKKTGSGTTSSVHSRRPAKSNSRTCSRGTTRSRTRIAKSGAYIQNEKPLSRSAARFAPIPRKRAPPHDDHRDEPRGAEEQRGIADALCLEQQKAHAEEPEMDVRAPERAPPQAGDRRD